MKGKVNPEERHVCLGNIFIIKCGVKILDVRSYYTYKQLQGWDGGNFEDFGRIVPKLHLEDSTSIH